MDRFLKSSHANTNSIFLKLAIRSAPKTELVVSFSLTGEIMSATSDLKNKSNKKGEEKFVWPISNPFERSKSGYQARVGELGSQLKYHR